jgi:NhaA family Na+:H+ antiporter
MIGPALLYVALNFWSGEPALRRGWAIPCATDIAFSYLAAQFIFRRGHPALPFLLLLAIADDALGLAILALAYPTATMRYGEFVAFLIGALVVAWLLHRRRVMSFWPYVLGAGLLSWLAFFRGGLHPALALVPIIPFLPQGERAGPPRTAGTPLHQFGMWWHTPVQLILFLFGLVNAGVPLTGVGVGTWIVLAALLAGKPFGILLSVAAAQWVGLHRPPGVSWRDMLVLGVTAGIGFTIAMFFATAAFPSGRLLGETKMGALISISAAALAIILARALHVGRFRRTVLP